MKMQNKWLVNKTLTKKACVILISVVQTLAQGPHTASGQFLCGPRTLCVQDISQNHKYSVLAAQL